MIAGTACLVTAFLIFAFIGFTDWREDRRHRKQFDAKIDWEHALIGHVTKSPTPPHLATEAGLTWIRPACSCGFDKECPVWCGNGHLTGECTPMGMSPTPPHLIPEPVSREHLDFLHELRNYLTEEYHDRPMHGQPGYHRSHRYEWRMSRTWWEDARQALGIEPSFEPGAIEFMYGMPVNARDEYDFPKLVRVN